VLEKIFPRIPVAKSSSTGRPRSTEEIFAPIIAARDGNAMRGMQRWKDRERELKQAGTRYAHAPCIDGCHLHETMAVLIEAMPEAARWELAYDPACDFVVLIRIELPRPLTEEEVAAHMAVVNRRREGGRDA
jgi:hypothetical protein